MNINVNDTTNKQLDWLVAKALGCDLILAHDDFRAIAETCWPEVKIIEELAKIDNDWKIKNLYHNAAPIPAYSTSWSDAGWIIEKERIELRPNGTNWVAIIGFDKMFASGDTFLIAAMRCFVASKLGAEVEIPEGLN